MPSENFSTNIIVFVISMVSILIGILVSLKFSTILFIGENDNDRDKNIFKNLLFYLLLLIGPAFSSLLYFFISTPSFSLFLFCVVVAYGINLLILKFSYKYYNDEFKSIPRLEQRFVRKLSLFKLTIIYFLLISLLLSGDTLLNSISIPGFLSSSAPAGN